MPSRHAHTPHPPPDIANEAVHQLGAQTERDEEETDTAERETEHETEESGKRGP